MQALGLLESLGDIVVSLVRYVGNITLFFLYSLANIFLTPFYLKQTLRSFFDIGMRSIGVISISSFFMGSVFVMQTYIGLSRFSAISALAEASVVAITREIGPLLVGLVLAGRVGASIAAELSTMQVTEQVDALRTLSISPYKYLVVPRVVSAALAFPLLGMLSDIIGVYGGYLVGVHKLSNNPYFYVSSTMLSLNSYDVVTGLIKACCFGVIISLVGCYYGLKANQGARGVGEGVTRSVIVSSGMVLLGNYMLTSMFFSTS